MSVFRRPAAGAVQVAGRGGVQQNGPGHIAPLFFPHSLLPAAADQGGIDNKVFQKGLPHAHIQLEHLPDQLIPVALRVLQYVMEYLPLGCIEIVLVKVICPVQQLGQILLRLTLDILQRLLCRKRLYRFHHRFFLHWYLPLFCVRPDCVHKQRHSGPVVVNTLFVSRVP